MRTPTLRWLALLPALLLSACVDDTPAGGGPADAPPTCDVGTDVCTFLLPVGYTGNRELGKTVEQGVPVRGFHIEVPIQVRWSKASDDPIPNSDVSWQLVDSSMSGSQIDVATSRTDGSGVATVTLRSGQRNGQFEVHATAPSANEAVFKVSLVSKDDGAVKVTVHYDGGNYGAQEGAFADVQLQLFRQGAGSGPCGALNACDQEGFDPYDPTSLPLPACSSHVLNMLPGEHTFSSGFKVGDYVSMVAYGRQDYDGTRVPLAWGCWTADENNPQEVVQAGQDLEVDINLQDLTPRYAGTYNVVSYFDMLAMVPNDVETWIRDFGNLFRNPGDQLVKWLRNIPEVEDFFGSLPAGFGDAITGVLNDILNSLIEEQLPDIVGDIRDGVVDVFDILTQLEVHSRLEFGVEPGAPPGGSLPGVLVFPACEGGGSEPGEGVKPVGQCPQRESWIAIGFNWRNSSMCTDDNASAECTGHRLYNLATYDQLDAVQGEFNAYTTRFWDLTIEQHSLTLAWGQLLLFAVEQIILPVMFGSAVDGLDDLLYMLVGGRECIAAAGDNIADYCCTQFTERGAIAGWDSAYKAALKSICKQGVPLLITQLREQLTDQDVGTGDNFLIGTSDDFEVGGEGEGEGEGEAGGKPCKLYDEIPKDLKVDLLGKEAAGARCEWRAGLVIGGLEPDLIEAEFYTPKD